MTVDPAQVRAIFLDAVEKWPSDRWDPFLDEACAGDVELRGQVAVLLDAHRHVGGFLDQGAVAPPKPVGRPALQEASGEAAGADIGAYKLLEQMGEGGFGVVFLAQ